MRVCEYCGVVVCSSVRRVDQRAYASVVIGSSMCVLEKGCRASTPLSLSSATQVRASVCLSNGGVNSARVAVWCPGLLCVNVRPLPGFRLHRCMRALFVCNGGGVNSVRVRASCSGLLVCAGEGGVRVCAARDRLEGALVSTCICLLVGGCVVSE